MAGDPGQCPLHDPAAGQYLEGVQVIGSPDDLQRELRLELGRGPGDELSSVAAVGRAGSRGGRDGAERLAGIVPQVREPGAQAEVDFGDVTVKLGGQLSRCFLFAFRLSCSGEGARSHIKPPMASPKARRRCDRIMAGYPVHRPANPWHGLRLLRRANIQPNATTGHSAHNADSVSLATACRWTVRRAQNVQF